MVSIIYLGLTLSLLLLALCANSSFSKPADTASRRAVVTLQQQVSNRHTNDDRWRMSSAISALNYYTYALERYYEDQPAPIHISIDDGNHTLKGILSRVCNLVAFYELATKVDPTTNSTNLYPLLSEVIRTSCNWMKYLVHNTSSMTMTDHLNNLSCSPTGVTPLHLYCYQLRASDLWKLTNVGRKKLNDKLAGYFGLLPAAHNWEEWLDTTTLSVTQKMKIKNNINQGISNIILAILQSIMKP